MACGGNKNVGKNVRCHVYFFFFFFLNSRSKAPEMKRGSEKGKGKIPTEKSKKGGNNLGNGWLSCW